MDFRNVVEELRPARKLLVIAAEAAASKLAGTKIQPTQLNHLVAVCGDATCSEEIGNYIRYQEARESWPRGTAEDVISAVMKALEQLEIKEDVLQVGAWRLYAVFLARAFKYARVSETGQRPERAGAHHDNRGKHR